MKELDSETWLPVVGFEGLYEVSDLGRVKSLDRVVINSLGHVTTRKGSVFSCKPDKNSGYVRVHLSKNGVKKTDLVHRLVATAFWPNPENKPQVNHKNLIRSDNRKVNLEWSTPSENSSHAYINGRNPSIGETHHLSRLSSSDVLEIINLVDTSELTYKQIGLKYGIAEPTVKSISRGLTWNSVTNRKANLPPLKIRGEFHPRSRSVINCRGIKFNTQREAATFYGLKSHKSISEALVGRQKSGGKYLDGTPIKWYYYDEFILKDGCFDGV